MGLRYEKWKDFVVQHIFNETNFRAETQPFIRHKNEMKMQEKDTIKKYHRSNEAMKP